MTTSKPSVGRALDALEDHRRGVGAFLAAHDGRADAIRPDLQLLGGRGAEGVARGEQNLFPVGDQLGRELADGRGLAAAVDADDQQARTACASNVSAGASRVRICALRWRRKAQTASGSFRSLRVSDVRISSSNSLAGAHADVGGQQHLLDLVDDAGIQLLAPGEDLAEARNPARPRARQPGRQRGDILLGFLLSSNRFCARFLERRGRRGNGMTWAGGRGSGARSGRAGRSAGVGRPGGARAPAGGMRRRRVGAVGSRGLRGRLGQGTRGRRDRRGLFRRLLELGLGCLGLDFASRAFTRLFDLARRRARARDTARYPTRPVTPRPLMAATSS